MSKSKYSGKIPEIKLRRVPATDAVVGAEVTLIVSESVCLGSVPLGVHEHVRALLVYEPRDFILTLVF